MEGRQGFETGAFHAARREHAWRLRTEGLSFAVIANRLGVSKSRPQGMIWHHERRPFPLPEEEYGAFYHDLYGAAHIREFVANIDAADAAIKKLFADYQKALEARRLDIAAAIEKAAAAGIPEKLLERLARNRRQNNRGMERRKNGT